MMVSIALGLIAALLGLAWQLGVVWLIVTAWEPTPDMAGMGWAVAGHRGLVVHGRLASSARPPCPTRSPSMCSGDLRLALAAHLAQVPDGGFRTLRRQPPCAGSSSTMSRASRTALRISCRRFSANFTVPLIVLVVLFALDWGWHWPPRCRSSSASPPCA